MCKLNAFPKQLLKIYKGGFRVSNTSLPCRNVLNVYSTTQRPRGQHVAQTKPPEDTRLRNMRGQLKDLQAVEDAAKALDSWIGHPHMYVCLYAYCVCAFLCL